MIKKQKIIETIWIIFFGGIIPLITLDFALNSAFVDNFAVFLANKIFLIKYGFQYRGYFVYAIDAVIVPFIIFVGLSSWVFLLYIGRNGELKKASFKFRFRLTSDLCHLNNRV